MLDKYENSECSEDESDDIRQEESVVERRGTGFLGGFERGVVCAREVPVEFGEIDLVQDESQGRHEDIRHKGADDFTKSGSDNNADGEVDNVSSDGK